MRTRRRRLGGEPGSGTRDPASLEMETTIRARAGSAKQAGHELGFYLAGQGFLRRRVAFCKWMLASGADDAAQRAQKLPGDSQRQGRGGQKAGRSWQRSSWQAEKLATKAAGACSAANLAPSPPAAMPRNARRQSSSETGRPIRWHMAERTSQAAVRRPVRRAAEGTVRQEYRTLDHPEHERNRQKALLGVRELTKG